MVDVGCGSGQSTEVFAPYFDQVTGVDPSEKQIELARSGNKFANVEYKVGDGEELAVEDGSVDMVACGQSAHWLDHGRFFMECKRVLKPNGCLVLHGYDRPVIRGFQPKVEGLGEVLEKSDEIFKQFYEKCLFHPRRHHVDNHYRDIEILYESQRKVRDESAKIEFNGKFSDFVSYLSTWSGYRSFMEKISKDFEKSSIIDKNSPELQKDILYQLCKDLKQIWACDKLNDDEIMVDVAWDVFIIMSEVPHLKTT
uniref:putative methyltransferase DDB_G0268948 n=1 Tax=Ciona intestinalis TaxID=7719 RepID=UPI000180B161|nr:putative methyltransferase DDB_G0268948 [Ciona intestinalis]|eukprot:XP_002121710.1 putative methyltransferase DDB_G0268948 [Ciona intestinalis]